MTHELHPGQYDQTALASALLDSSVYGLTPGETIEKLETHISYVFLAGAHAYKIKKAMHLGFLDFRPLAARRFYCEEELRLNRRLAPALYLAVIPITGTQERPVLDGDGVAFEYAVKMRRFPQECLLDRLLASGRLTNSHIDALAASTAAFHRDAAIASPDDAFGTAAAVTRPALENFAQLRAAGAIAPDLHAQEQWTIAEARTLEAAFEARKRGGFVRECHGDLHLRNVALIDGEVTLFDCIEFDANLRWIDVMNDIAFLVMDLHDRGRSALAHRFLNRYLEITGDYAGLRVLRFYVVYRALVRAKIHWLRAHQDGIAAADRTRVLDQYSGYLALALAQARDRRPAIVLTHGLSGSGKTTCAQALLERIGAIRLRSDVERKRLQGLDALAHTRSGVAQGAYAAGATARTYAHLRDVADSVVACGYPVVVDAAFLVRAQRDMFRQLAAARATPFLILDVTAEEAVLRARILERRRQRNDPSEADLDVLEHQLRTQEPLGADERAIALEIQSGAATLDAAAWTQVLERLGQRSG